MDTRIRRVLPGASSQAFLLDLLAWSSILAQAVGKDRHKRNIKCLCVVKTAFIVIEKNKLKM